jgi:hypothetical protein
MLKLARPETRWKLAHSNAPSALAGPPARPELPAIATSTTPSFPAS